MITNKMKSETKYFGLSVIGLITLIVITLGLVTALTLSGPSSITFRPSDEGSSKTFTINSDENMNILTSFPFTQFISDSEAHQVSFTINNIGSLLDTKSVEFEITLDSIDSNFEFGTFSETFTIEAENATDDTITDSIDIQLTLDNTEFCDFGEVGDLKVEIDDLHASGFAADDDEWYPLDEIEIDVQVDNDGDEKISDIVVEWCLYDTENKECVMDDEENEFDLKKGKDEKLTISFQVDPDDLDEGVEDYIFFVKAYSNDEGEDVQCVSDFVDINILLEDNFVILDDIKVPESAQCDQEITLTADVWNIGQDEQEDVFISLYNPTLGLDNERVDISSIEPLDKEKMNFNFRVPKNIEEGTYTIELRVFDEDGDLYETDDGEESKFTIDLKVEGSCKVEPKAKISAVLESGGESGKELVIKATITNTGSDTETFSIEVDDYGDWAELVEIEPSALILSAGSSEEVLLTFNVNKDAEGDKVLNIKAKVGAEEVVKQPVLVTIEKTGFGFPSLTGFAISGENWYLYAIGALNVILVIVIIIVAIRVSRS